ncbi:MAG: hypothetical protein CTY19_13320 [Methylomonas sp.]|nr:MAG: hypothetical protein CTY19_13320 [Methylomonas sp.]
MLIRLIQLILLTFTLAQSAQAAMITESGGIMTGATGIDVGGKLYDMELKDGTCVLLFGGCDEQSDFPFDAAGTQLALTQLQILISSSAFSNSPGLISGCPSSFICSFINPYEIHNVSGFIVMDEFRIYAFGSLPLIFQDVLIDPNFDTSIKAIGAVYAIWTAQPTGTIPEPSSLLLIGMGLLGQRLVRARSKRLPV